jgi:peptide/nickel transport system ATP-binding protein
MALIGESGSGKSVTLRALMRLHPPKSSVLRGTINVGGEAVLNMNAQQLRPIMAENLRDDFRNRAGL